MIETLVTWAVAVWAIGQLVGAAFAAVAVGLLVLCGIVAVLDVVTRP